MTSITDDVLKGNNIFKHMKATPEMQLWHFTSVLDIASGKIPSGLEETYRAALARMESTFRRLKLYI